MGYCLKTVGGYKCKCTPSTLVHNDIEVSKAGVTSDFINTHFTDITEYLTAQIYPSHRIHPITSKKSEQSLFFSPVTRSDVSKILQGESNSLSAGTDCIYDYINKHCLTNYALISIAAPALQDNFLTYKLSKMIQLHKRGSKKYLNNY